MPIMGFSVIKWAGGIAILLSLIESLKMSRSPQLASSPQGKVFIILIVLNFTYWLIAGNLSLNHPIQTYLSFTMLFFLTMTFVNSRKRLRLAVWAIILTMLYASQLSVRQYISVMGLYPIYRLSGTFKDVNYFALSILIVIPFAYYLLKTVRYKIIRMSLYVSMGLYSTALMFTFSRGGIIGVAVMAVVSQVISKKKIKTLMVLSVVVVLGFYFAPDSLKNRFEDTKILEEGEAQGGAALATTHRYNSILAGLNMIKANPLTGVGLGNFRSLSLQYGVEKSQAFIAHNTYISIAAEQGLPALVLFMSIIAFTYRSLWRLRRDLRGDEELALLPSVMIVSLSGFVVAALLLTAENTKFFWLLVFLTIALERIVKEQKQREDQDAIDVEAQRFGDDEELADTESSGKSNGVSASTADGAQSFPPRRQKGWSGGLD
jgi:O-antigen ligase